MRKSILILLGCVILSLDTFGQTTVLPASKKGFSYCILSGHIHDEARFSMPLYLHVKVGKKEAISILIQLHQFFAVLHKTRQMDECAFKSFMRPHIYNDDIIVVDSNEMKSLMDYKVDKTFCPIINSMSLSKFIDSFFVKDETDNFIHFRYDVKPTIEEENCIFIKLYENKITSGRDAQSGYILLSPRPYYLD